MLKELLLAVVVGSFAGGALFKFIEFIIERHDKKKEKKAAPTPLECGMRALLRDRLRTLLRNWKHADDRTADEWEDIEDMYNSYVALGGNGEIKKLFAECADIPTTE